MKSYLLTRLAVALVPLAVLVGGALLLKGHDDPGGGFVGGLSLAIGGILAIAAFGPRATLRGLGVAPEVVALVGVAVVLLALVLPALGGRPLLTHSHGELPLLGKWHAALLFDIGVTLAVAGAATAAALRLWQSRPATAASRREED